MRFLTLPMFLFSATFFPLSQLPAGLHPLRLDLAAVARRRALPRRHHRHRSAPAGGPRCWPTSRARRLHRGRLRVGLAGVHPKVGDVTTTADRPDDAVRSRRAQAHTRPGPVDRGCCRARRCRRRSACSSATSSRTGGMWLAFIIGLVEPLLLPVLDRHRRGRLVGKVPGPGGQPIAYDQFVAPGLMAAAAMNGAVLDTTFNFFFKFKYVAHLRRHAGDAARGRATSRGRGRCGR